MSLTSDVTSVVSEIETSSLDEATHILGKAQAILDFETENDFELALKKVSAFSGKQAYYFGNGLR